MFCWYWTSISNPNIHIHQHSCPPGSGSGCKHTLILAYLKMSTSHEPKAIERNKLVLSHVQHVQHVHSIQFFRQLLCFTATHAPPPAPKSCQHGNPSLFGRRKVPVTFARHSLRKNALLNHLQVEKGVNNNADLCHVMYYSCNRHTFSNMLLHHVCGLNAHLCHWHVQCFTMLHLLEIVELRERHSAVRP